MHECQGWLPGVLAQGVVGDVLNPDTRMRRRGIGVEKIMSLVLDLLNLKCLCRKFGRKPLSCRKFGSRAHE